MNAPYEALERLWAAQRTERRLTLAQYLRGSRILERQITDDGRIRYVDRTGAHLLREEPSR